MTKEWINRAREMPPDPISGAEIVRIDAGLNIYCERPAATPDGRRFTIWTEPIGEGPVDIVDLPSQSHCRLESSAVGAFDHAYNESCYLWYPPATPGKPHEIRRFSLATLREEPVVALDDPPFGIQPGIRGFGGAASPKGDYIYYTIAVSRAIQVMRIDLRTGKCKAIFEHPEMINPHMQVDPVSSGDILLQLNPGSHVDENGAIHYCCTPGAGAAHVLINSDGENLRRLAIGEPITYPSSGHCCWMVGQHRIVVCTGWTLNPPERFNPDVPADWAIDKRHPATTLWTVGPENERPTPIVAPEHHFFHVSSGPGGRYAVCNSTPGRRCKSEIVVVDLETRKYRTLVSQVQCQKSRTELFPHSLPYFTGDLKHVIYNVKDDLSLPGLQGFAVHAVKVPEGFLESVGDIP